MKTKNKT